MQVTALNSTNVVATLKARAQQASKDFIKNPNATHWIVQTRTAFVYQQAYYYLGNVSRTASEKQHLLDLLHNEQNGNWGDVICQCALGVGLTAALREFASCP